MVTLPVKGDVDPDTVDEDGVDTSLNDGVKELMEENMPSHEARRMANGKKKVNRFITRNSQGDSKSDTLQCYERLDGYTNIFLCWV